MLNKKKEEKRNIPIDLLNKRIRCQESNRPRQQAVNRARQKAIAEEQQGRHEARDVQLEEVIPDAVCEDPRRTAAAGEEALPPPVVVLVFLLAVLLKTDQGGREARWVPQRKADYTSR